MTVVETLFDTEIKLPSPPAIAVRILEIVKRDDSSVKALAQAIQADPALATKMLRLVNSAFYCRPRRIGSIDTAVAVLGANAVKNIALSFLLSRSFKGHRGERFDFDRFWRRSVTSAVACELICAEIHFRNDEAFITALLQDIGVAAMLTCQPDKYMEVLNEKFITGCPIVEAERRILGTDHQEIGSELLKRWGLPESIYLPIRYHHETDNVPRGQQTMCNLLRAADRISAIYYGTSSTSNVRAAKELLSTAFGIGDERSTHMIDRAAESSTEILAQFEIKSGNIKPFSQILQEANEELSRLSISYEMLVMEYKQARERAELLAAELKKANEGLQSFAFRDSQTGLYNHRYFQEALGRELTGAERYKRPLSLIMMDIDHFKKVNDTHGHQHGDLVLKTVGLEILQRMRKGDLVARYGGDEIAIVLPETTLSTAISLGEVCRVSIEKAIKAAGVAIPVTVSLGVAAYDPENPVDKDQLIRAADGALYRSKQAGRNRVSA